MELEMQKLKNQIIDAFSLYDLSDEEQNEFILKVAESVLETSIVRALTKMPEEKHDDYEMYLTSNPKPDDVYNYLVKNVPEFNQIIEEELQEFVKLSQSLEK